MGRGNRQLSFRDFRILLCVNLNSSNGSSYVMISTIDLEAPFLIQPSVEYFVPIAIPGPHLAMALDLVNQVQYARSRDRLELAYLGNGGPSSLNPQEPKDVSHLKLNLIDKSF